MKRAFTVVVTGTSNPFSRVAVFNSDAAAKTQVRLSQSFEISSSRFPLFKRSPLALETNTTPGGSVTLVTLFGSSVVINETVVTIVAIIAESMEQILLGCFLINAYVA